VAESQKVRMGLEDLKIKSFATTPSLKHDEGTVRGLDTCGACTITTDDACNIETCGLTCGLTWPGGGNDGGDNCTNITGGGCDAVSNGCVTTNDITFSCYDTCEWGAISNF
jgi:hypothetical protein